MSKIDSDNIEKQIKKGTLEFAVLLIINNKNVYSSEILTKLAKAELITTEGTIYPLLSRLTKEGLLDYFWEESCEGSPRKYYSLTQKGEQALKYFEQSWENISKSINYLIL